VAFGSDYLRDARIVVIGAGAMGAAISYRLAQAGAEVTTVERRYPGAGTTGSSFAWLNGFSKHPREYHRLNVMSIRDHQDLADELNADWAHVDGALHWARSDEPIQLANLRETIQRLRGWGVRLDQTSPEIAMRELEPDLWIDPEAVPEVYLVHREGWLDSVAMAHGVMRAAITRYGAKLERATVTGLHGPSGAVSAVGLDDGRELPADVVINAAGPEAGRVAALAGVRLALDRQIGMLISTAPAPVWLRHVVRAADVHLRPDGGARLLIQRENLDSHAVEGQPTPVDAPIIQEAVERARAIAPGLAEVPAQSVRTGIRPMPRDGHPIVGFEPSVSGLYTAVTHSGITLSARLALLIAEELAGSDVSELAPYRPDRFAAVA
jgi:glycine/D-amino acid oxidase-like deaminating enzyme